ncbi:MAG: hypothetical protein GF317_06465 [Candidatus Lokiarchaeota archaeon]|nr:hypothetical protein [Candidatus Lokiarchaeota archaeon]MBD3199365.1 hypothetical protein [Candidatus Lokiarchaeota archaeon]
MVTSIYIKELVKLAIEYLTEVEQKAEKILFTGLDSAGKSSIVATLKREFSKIASIAPTRGAQKRIFNFLGKTISEWDLGGQRSYRISYLKSPNKFFENTSVAIYVIDIQDNERFDEALSYLRDVVDKFDELAIEPTIYIFFHKYDPVLSQNALNKYKEIIMDLKQNIIEKIKYDDFHFIKTSIFDISSIIKGISEILLELFPKAILIEKTIKEFAEKSSAEGVVLLDNNSLIIGDFFIDNEIEELLNNSMPYFLTLHDRLKNAKSEEKNLENGLFSIETAGKFFIFNKINLGDEIEPYFILIVKGSTDYEEENIEILSSLLKEILKKD